MKGMKGMKGMEGGISMESMSSMNSTHSMNGNESMNSMNEGDGCSMTDGAKLQILSDLLGSGAHIGQLFVDNHGTVNINNAPAAPSCAAPFPGTDPAAATPAPTAAATPASLTAATCAPAPDFAGRLAQAVSLSAGYFWGNASWAVVYRVSGYKGSMSDFERLVAGLSCSPAPRYPCPLGTVQKTLSNHSYMHSPVDKWLQLGATPRVLRLVDALQQVFTPAASL